MTTLETGPRVSLPWLDLRSRGAAPVLVAGDRTVSYAELADRVDERRRELGSTRRLVVLEGANRLDVVVDHLAALVGAHPTVLVPPGGAHRLLGAYDPDVVIADGVLVERRQGTRHELHPDLALLLSTSGTSGSPKLVRLSVDNLRANADAIASYLALHPDDQAATSLPLHYCYGLSVLHSHLAAGASTWLTEESVVDDAFWSGFAETGATGLAGVPHSFELLDGAGFPERVLPGLCRLRRVTQAGGAMPPARVRAWAELGRRHGFEFFVMYGATEATARMAYLPPGLAAARPDTIGIPVPGGDLRIEDGELVYSGPNVMLGYATSPTDLALGRSVTELRTGDLAVQHDDGLFQVTGRRSRLAKLFGLRVDLDHGERLLRERGVHARLVEHDGRIFAFVRHGRAAQAARAALADETCLPTHAVTTRIVPDFPLTSSGKTDYPALVELAASDDHRPQPADRDVRAIFASVLGRPDAADHHSFVDLGGDSLSFVEVSVRLERLLGRLPARWHERSIGELAAFAPRPRRWTAHVDTPLALRALAILLVVGSHTEWFGLQGGAHLLLALVGYNLARFQLAPRDRSARLRGLARSLRDVLVPSVLWIGTIAVLTGAYTWTTALMLTNLVGPRTWSDQWQFWFLEAAMWSTLALLAALAVPSVHAFEVRRPWAFALGWLGAATVLRLTTAGVEAGPIERYSAPTVAWCAALGYLAARATTLPQRLVATAVTPLVTLGFFGEPVREAVRVTGVLLLLWLPTMPVPRGLPSLLAPLAAASRSST